MSTQKFTSTLTTAVALLAFAAALPAADEDEDQKEDAAVLRLIRPASDFGFGIGYLDADNQRFGQYTGLREQGFHGLLDLSFVQRDEETGTWLWITGRNLGLEDREARIERRRQGDWGYFVDYSETPRYNPFVMSTTLAGIGNPNLTVGGAALHEAQLKTRRQAFTLGVDKRLLRNFTFQTQVRSEEKDGARQFARGTPGAMEFLAEPIDQTVHQLEATVSFAGARLQWTGGYYGTTFDNSDTALNIAGGAAALSGGAAPFTPIGLPPDNRSHQLYWSGGYSFTPSARGTFKAAYTRQTQDDEFILPSVTGRSDLGGRLDVTLLQAGFSARPLPKLSLVANLRYEDRDDQTPIAQYFTGVGPTSTSNGENEPRSIRTTAGKIEAGYPLPMALRLTAGIDYEEKSRNASPVRVVSAREETREWSWRAELRRSLSDTLSGALSAVHAERDGSPFLTTVRNDGTPGSNLVAPLQLADRDRDKLRLLLDWVPIEPLSLQLLADYAEDEYGGRVFGLQSGRASNYSLDAGYRFSEAWQATLWASHNDTRAQQRTQAAAPNGQLWAADLRHRDEAWGLEARGKPRARLQIGAGMESYDYRDEYRQAALTGAAIASLPDIETQQRRFKLFAILELKTNVGLRLDLIHDRWRTDDWTWTTWTYTDGTQLVQDPRQSINFIALSGYLKTW